MLLYLFSLASFACKSKQNVFSSADDRINALIPAQTTSDQSHYNVIC